MDFSTYATIKALHIIFVVSWFAGLFYIVRLFIYHIEAQAKEATAKMKKWKKLVIDANNLEMANERSIKHIEKLKDKLGKKKENKNYV